MCFYSGQVSIYVLLKSYLFSMKSRIVHLDFDHDNYILRDHKVYDVSIIPGVTYLDLIVRAARQLFDRNFRLSKILFTEPLATTKEYDRKLEIAYSEGKTSAYEAVLRSQRMDHKGATFGPWTEHMHCRLDTFEQQPVELFDVNAFIADSQHVYDVKEVYAKTRKAEIFHGEFMQAKGKIYQKGEEELMALHLSELAEEYREQLIAHPAFLDGSTFAGMSFGLQEGQGMFAEGIPFIPFSIDQFEICLSFPSTVYVYSQKQVLPANKLPEVIKNDITLYDEKGRVLARFRGLTSKRIRHPELIRQLIEEPVMAPAEPAGPSREHPLPSADKGIAAISRYLKEIIAEKLVKPVSAQEEDTGFYELGLDSKQTMELVRQLEEKCGHDFYPTLLFEYQTIKALSEYLSQQEAHHFETVREQVTTKEANTQKIPEQNSPSPYKQSPHDGLPDEPIAIIGISGKYPGASNVNEFWENLRLGKNSITEIPRDRWDIENFYSEEKGGGGKSYSKWGGFLDDVDKFDPLFFNISPEEAENMDPQVRLFLEESWKTLEDGGYTPQKLSKEKVGVFAGVFWTDYQLFRAEVRTPSVFPSSFVSLAANTVSYHFGFQGPSIGLDTQCSSSLTALHLACESLRRGESTTALAGGVNLSLHPSKYNWLSNSFFLSSKGLCESFGEGGEGYVPAEGVGVLLLKPLNKAAADGDLIYGVIRGTAINHGGRSSGLTVPNPNAQAAVIQEAMRRAGVKAEDFSYIEAHGTGTRLGDPIEIAGLAKAFQSDRKQYCSIGSVKSNIGHCESASGMAGITKVLLQMKHKQLVPSLHSVRLNPNIDFANSPFRVQQELETWSTQNNEPRLAGISSFGAGGSNAHIIIEEYRPGERRSYSNAAPAIVILSGRNAESLKRQALNLKNYLVSNPDTPLHNIAYTLQVGREAMAERLAIVSNDLEELRAQLISYLEGRTDHLLAGNIKKENLDFLLEGGVIQASINYAIEQNELRSLAQLWVKGVPIDWHLLYGEHRPDRIALPAYPFARERYWIPNQDNPPALTGSATLHTYSSTLNEQSFTSVNKPSFTHLYSNAWQLSEIAATSHQETNSTQLVLLAGGTVDLADKLQEALAIEVEAISHETPAAYFILVLERLKTKLQEKLPTHITVVYPNTDYLDYSFVSGLLKTAAWENPKITGKTIGVESLSVKELSALTEILGAEQYTTETEVRYREGKRESKVVRSVSDTQRGVNAVTIKEGGVYLVTGGAGGLGRIFAEHISKTKDTKLILTGRSQLSKEDSQSIANIPNALYYRCDVSHKEEVVSLMEMIKDKYHQLDGIIHSAGTIRDSFIIKKTAAEVSQVLPPKIQGVRHLDEATKELALDFVVFFSSLAGVLGNMGQADYASANAWMDNYAHYRNEQMNKGLRQGKTLSINWPLWKDGGMQVGEETQKYLERQWGLLPLPAAEGIAAFETLLSSNTDQGIVTYGPGEKIFIRDQPTTRDQATTPDQAIAPHHATGSHRSAIEAILTEICSSLLKLDKEHLDTNTHFSAYGIDSIKMMKILNMLESRFKIAIEPSAIASYPTIALLAEYLETEKTMVLPAPAAAAAQAAAPASTPLPSVTRIPNRQQGTGKVAIIGMSCKLPQSDSLDEYWDNLQAGRDLISEMPADRWEAADYYSAEAATDKTYTTKGGFLKNAGLFDTLYFNISDKAAISMDPQQRIILELTRDLLSHAGYSKEELANTKTGVYIGAKDNNYVRNNYHLLPEGTHQLTFVNNISNMIAARVSDFYDWKGTSQVIDTACSSSLVAVHQACDDILNGKATMAIAGGISILVDAFAHIGFSQAEVLSRDGRSYVFDERAAGFVLAEGAGLVMLKDYDQALADGDQIFGVIAGSSVNNDGQTMGLTVPNKEGQKEVIKEALEKAKISPAAITYYEAHGTGTLLGDPIEIKAATEVYRVSTTNKQYCALGSVKSNLGHTIMAAGITGLIKILLQMQHDQLAPTLHCENPHPRFKFEESPFYPNTTLKAWNADKKIAALSSFGFGGTNCHMIIEKPQTDAALVKRTALPVVRLSSKSYWLGQATPAQNDEPAISSLPLPSPAISSAAISPPASYSPADHNMQFTAYLQLKMAKAMSLPQSEISVVQNFMDMGLDSIQLIGISQQLEKELDIELYPTLFFEYQNIELLVGYFINEHAGKLAEKFGSKTDSPQMAAAPEKADRPQTAGAPEKTNNPRTAPRDNPRTASEKEDIAIIGMSGYLPRSASLAEFWDHIAAGTRPGSEIPGDRWDYKSWFDENKEADNKTYCKWGGFLKDIDKFDPLFFGIAPVQAKWMDPQVRLFLQSAYHTFEDAGVVNEIRGSRTGVYVGSCFQEYWDEIVRAQTPISNYQHNSSAMSSLSTSVSYHFDLRGGSIPLDNACASSLTALHLGCQAIRHGEIDMAVIGGLNVLLSPLHYVNFSRMQALSPTGRCNTFDKKADGYVPGEGVVSLLIKPLSRALADGNKIHGIIKGSAINHVGKSNNPTSPRPELQTELLIDAWTAARINPEDISYIEAHGTGTVLGDPIEINALKKAFKQYTDKKGFCAIGSTKANAGHLEGAAGLAGVIKVLLMMKNRTIPAMPNFKELNPYIKIDDSPFRINKRNEPWESDKPFLVGVSSFGMTGNNAHVVIEEYQSADKPAYDNPSPAIILLSARNEDRLRSQAANLNAFLQSDQGAGLHDIAYTLQTDREPMEQRLALIVKDKEDLTAQLTSYLQGGSTDLISRKSIGDRSDILLNGKGGQAYIHKAIKEKELGSLALLWVSGSNIDWTGLYPVDKPGKISLPMYPFAMDRYWIPPGEGKIAEKKKNPHPLLHKRELKLKYQID